MLDALLATATREQARQVDESSNTALILASSLHAPLIETLWIRVRP